MISIQKSIEDGIIEIFFHNPFKKYGVRDVAREVGISTSTAHNYLNQLVKEGLLVREKDGKFMANSSSYLYRAKKIAYNVIYLEEQGVVEFLFEEFNYPPAIVLFGSWSKGENVKGKSDVDLFILAPSTKKVDLSSYESRIGYEIQLHIYSNEAFSNLKKSNPELVNSIINGITLRGYLEVFP